MKKYKILCIKEETTCREVEAENRVDAKSVMLGGPRSKFICTSEAKCHKKILEIKKRGGKSIIKK